MSSNLQAIWTVLGTLWTTFFTGWKIPLLNFTPATLMFGIMSFFVAIKFIKGIITITANGTHDSARKQND